MHIEVENKQEPTIDVTQTENKETVEEPTVEVTQKQEETQQAIEPKKSILFYI